MKKYNDINIKQWRDYQDILTDTLWIFNKRNNTGLHNGSYHGKFIPQIPYQLLTRYTKSGDWVLDPFTGSGTTLIEASWMGRNSVGIELQEVVAEDTFKRIKESDISNAHSTVICGDSSTVDL